MEKVKEFGVKVEKDRRIFSDKILNRNLIIFTDPGIDDAIAINEIMAKAPEYVQIYLCPVAGNAPHEVTFKNACRIATNRVSGIIESEAVDSVATQLDSSYAGEDGLGDCEYYRDKLYKGPIIQIEGIFESKYINTHIPTDLMVLSPCKVPLLFLQKMVVKNCAPYIENIYIMGGCERYGNMGEMEFNQYLAPQYFEDFIEMCYRIQETEGTKIHIATLDACESNALDMINLDVAGLNIPEASKALFNAGKGLAVKRGESNYFIYDLTIAWKYLGDIGVYPQQFIKRSHQLKETDITTTDIIVPYVGFINPCNPWLTSEETNSEEKDFADIKTAPCGNTEDENIPRDMMKKVKEVLHWCLTAGISNVRHPITEFELNMEAPDTYSISYWDESAGNRKFSNEFLTKSEVAKLEHLLEELGFVVY